jgi:hypothetical protein
MPSSFAPPIFLEVAFQLRAERAVVPATVEAAVDFAGLENKAAAFAQGDDFLHAGGIGDVFVGHDSVGWSADGSRESPLRQGGNAAEGEKRRSGVENGGTGRVIPGFALFRIGTGHEEFPVDVPAFSFSSHWRGRVGNASLPGWRGGHADFQRVRGVEVDVALREGDHDSGLVEALVDDEPQVAGDLVCIGGFLEFHPEIDAEEQ